MRTFVPVLNKRGKKKSGEKRNVIHTCLNNIAVHFSVFVKLPFYSFPKASLARKDLRK
jgi:hypothetical protein